MQSFFKDDQLSLVKLQARLTVDYQLTIAFKPKPLISTVSGKFMRE